MAEILNLKRRGDYPRIIKMVDGEPVEYVDIDSLTEEQFRQFCRDTGTEWFQNELVGERIVIESAEWERLQAENERLRLALAVCAADWISEPGTVMSTAGQLAREFKRRQAFARETVGQSDAKPSSWGCG